MAARIWTFASLLAAHSGSLVEAAVAACPVQVSSNVPAPVVAKGYAARLVTSSLTHPRGIIFDSAGHLLVVDSGVGVKSLTLDDHGGDCVGVKSTKVVVPDTSLNHGIEVSFDGKTLYASNPNDAYSYPYVPSTSTANTNARVDLVTNMTNGDHVTRTLLLPKKAPGLLLVSRGSDNNIDPLAENIHSGHAQIRAFDLASRGKAAFNYPFSGEVVGWGLRNDVGVAEHPVTGGIYSVENGVDNMVRDGVDIHQGDPSEKLNYFGPLKGTKSPNFGSNFGYPTCFAAWNVAIIPHNQGIKPGVQFAIGNATPAEDKVCQTKRTAPRLVFEPHQAPLDIKFNSAGSTAWVSFHGSFDRTIADGYKVCTVAFNAAKGDPVAPSTSKSACFSIVSNQNPTKCTGDGNCFRPVGLAFDKKGRLFFSSDETGSIYVITKADGSGVDQMSQADGG